MSRDISKDLMDLSSIDSDSQEIVKKIVNETDKKAIDDLISEFNSNMAKKNIVRLLKLDNVLDLASSSILERFLKRPDEFDTKDLLNCLQVIQSVIEKSRKDQTGISSSAIYVNNDNRQINVNISDSDESSFSRDSKERIMAAVQALMKRGEELNQDIEIDSNDIIEIESEEESNS